MCKFKMWILYFQASKNRFGVALLDGEVIKINEKDLVFVLNGSMTEGSAYGDSDHAL